MAKRVLFYLNQFFGGIGGEDKADFEPEFRLGEVIGPVMGIAGACGDVIEPLGVIICGDNFFGENEEEAKAFIQKVIDEQQPEIFVAGPAFNAGRYGFACAGACKVAHDAGVTCVSGMYNENPGLEHCQGFTWVAETANSAAKMRKAIPLMANLIKKLVAGEELTPEEDKYFPQGRRECYIQGELGADRAVDMLLARLNDQPFVTELPMAEFDEVDPAPAIKDLPHATIAIVSSSGVVPKGNPDRLQSASAQQWNKYNIADLDDLPHGDFYTVHGGYDPMYINEQPTRGVPLDIMRELEKEGKIGHVYDYYYITTGTGTAVANARKFGEEIGKELKEAGVDGVILTSTWGTCTRCGATMVKEIERYGIPIVHMATITTISESVGARRIVPTVAIPHPIGNPNLGPEDEHKLRYELCDRAVRALGTEITETTQFES